MAFLDQTAEMAGYAKLAYQEKAKIDGSLAGRPHRFFDQNGTQAFCVIEDRVATVAFRGTEGDESSDWITDFTISKIRHQRGKVHAGFYSATMMIAGEIMGWAIREGVDKWNVTGHSLGAALATLFAEHLGTDRVLGVYLFGAPRVGTGAFVRWYNEHLGDRTVRIVNNNDVVAHAPPLFFGYRHVGNTLWHFDEQGKMHDSRSWWGYVWFVMEWRAKGLFRLGSDGVKDHRMGTYQRLVEQHLAGE